MEITNAADIQKDTSTYLLYANPGIGKTHTAHYLEGKTLYIPIDRSETPLKGNANIDVVKFDTYNAWEAWNELLKWLGNADLSKYDTLFFDNVSELVRSMLANLGRNGNNNRVPSQGNYQQIDFFLMDSARFIQTLGKRIVFTAWETTDKWDLPSGQQINRAYPDIREKIRNNFMGLCQVVGRLTINPETEKRGFILQPSDYIYAKNQLDGRKACAQENIFKIGYEPSTEGEK
ncbi:AAA family ATPase [Lysinibacillus odysseyi]|uniref:DNA-binding protein n=1 Tax=Lysinibacillus odysseyi 34hs-1 = NBRC 100172 TaxID=1220589 RepID=A0A0A3J296_9BACI|nr:AAA family ATPase [Lysinibacillus odysseyi]KGR89273.1 DNA-binding protein [Lysinibacillus odysseyi 34hs-1 = NBRC 100172]